MGSRPFARSVLVLLSVLFIASFALADEIPRYTLGGSVLSGGSPDLAKAGGDTINLMAAHDDPTNGPGEPTYYGDFEDAAGNPDWNGWTSIDLTTQTQSHWQVSNYNQADPGNLAAWCGDMNFAVCDTNDPLGGYGNNWHDILEFHHEIPDPGSSTMVTVTATLQHDSEAGYDYTYLSYQFEDQPLANIATWDGAGTVAVSRSVTYLPGEYVGGSEIAVSFRFVSDGGWSDEDCMVKTAGGCQVDDINVHVANGSFTADYFEDFESGVDSVDFGIWATEFPVNVGDFAHIWTGLEDVDPCITNYSPQVAFIDDGMVVPGTGGSECLNWCYGPYGYIVTTTGGLAGPDFHIHNAIQSPIMNWPAPKSGIGPDDDGISLAFTVYQHEDLSYDAPGVFFTWGVRSADTDGSAGSGVQSIVEQPWKDRAFVYYGGPGYDRKEFRIPELMNPGRDVVQVQLAVYEIGWIWGWTGDDGYPAPYFDDVTVKIYPQLGPGMSARELDLAQDNFPERGNIDMTDPGSLHVRFDAARNISLRGDLRNDPGDTIVLDIATLRAGAGLTGDPELHYILDQNELFDPYRTAGLPASGMVSGMPAVGSTGLPQPDKWAFDLPDTGFLFPGDVLHYYISATDAIGGPGGSDPQTSLMPADTTGYSTGFGDALGYDNSFTVRALPHIGDNGYGDFDYSSILFINDNGSRGGEDEWYSALDEIGKIVDGGCFVHPDVSFDIYYVNSPTSGVGNGIGGRATALTLAQYDVILYTSGDLSVNTLSNGDYDRDPGDDVGTLRSWLDMGDKNMFLTGDDLAGDLNQSGAAGQDFLRLYLGVELMAGSLRELISGQTAPQVRPLPPAEQPVFPDYYESWIAYGGCRSINTFDGVYPLGGAVRLAEFTDPSGNRGVYSYSAATLNQVLGSQVISMPYDLMYVYTDPSGSFSPLSGRARVLQEVLWYFGIYGNVTDPSDVDLPGITFGAANHPNPFNPSTTIFYSLPRSGQFKLSIYNVRGQLVKTLVDGVRPAGEDQKAVWDGRDNLGSAAASGVYFYEARSGADVRIGKMTLVK